MTKQIKIEELIHFMRDGWVAMDRDYSWRWFNSKPNMKSCYWTTPEDDFFDVISDSAFYIKPAEDWTKSLIRIKGE